jgi:3-phosphoshikimate 1-carboxyvinyltransferase
MKYSKITLSSLDTVVHCPTSKSYANRALIMASLKNESIKLNDLPESQDVKDLLSLLDSLGLKISGDKENVLVKNSFPECEILNDTPILLPGSEGGTTIRFIVPVLALGQNEYHLPLLGRMAERPLDELIEILKRLGAKISIENSMIKVKGPITLSENLSVDCSETTQFATALFNLKAKYDLDVKYENLVASKKYLEMTESLVEHFSHSREFTIPADFSGLGYLVAYGCLNQDLIISNVNSLDPLQADSMLIEILRSAGANIKFKPSGLHVYRTDVKLKGFEIDGSKCIDLVPTLMFIASFCSAESRIKNIKYLVHKESDRLSEMMKIMDKFKVQYEYDEKTDTFVITPSSMKRVDFDSCQISTANDHRMVMVAALFLKVLAGGSVGPKDSVNKSFPTFFDIFK